MTLVRCIGFSCLAALAGLSCARETRLEPASAADVIAEDTAAEQAENVRIVTEVDAWMGDPGVLDHVTPMRVTIRNEGDEPLRIQYKRFQLASEESRRVFPALPPFQIRGTVTEPVLIDGYEPFEPGFVYDGFSVDPLYADAYPGIAPFEYGMDYDLGYYESNYAYWTQALPTPRMLALALPEGVLQPGGQVTGFLYFQKVPEELEKVSFRAELVNAQSGQVFGQLAIPFRVRG